MAKNQPRKNQKSSQSQPTPEQPVETQEPQETPQEEQTSPGITSDSPSQENETSAPETETEGGSTSGDGDAQSEDQDAQEAQDGDGKVYQDTDPIAPVNVPEKAVQAAQTDFQGHNVAAPKGRIIEPGEEVVFDGETVGNMLIVKEDVFQKVKLRNSRRHSYRLLYRKGTAVPVNSVRRRG